MKNSDLKGIKFIRGNKCHKYIAILPDGSRVPFGHKSYEHYKDQVPTRQGGGIWSHKDHLDEDRRIRYRKRHTRINQYGILTKNVKYSPEWFSYYLLW